MSVLVSLYFIIGLVIYLLVLHYNKEITVSKYSISVLFLGGFCTAILWPIPVLHGVYASIAEGLGIHGRLK